MQEVKNNTFCKSEKTLVSFFYMKLTTQRNSPSHQYSNNSTSEHKDKPKLEMQLIQKWLKNDSVFLGVKTVTFLCAAQSTWTSDWVIHQQVYSSRTMISFGKKKKNTPKLDRVFLQAFSEVCMWGNNLETNFSNEQPKQCSYNIFEGAKTCTECNPGRFTHLYYPTMRHSGTAKLYRIAQGLW